MSHFIDNNWWTKTCSNSDGEQVWFSKNSDLLRFSEDHASINGVDLQFGGKDIYEVIEKNAEKIREEMAKE